MKFSEKVTDISNFFDKYVDSKYSNIVRNDVINIKELLKEERVVIESIISKYLYQIYKDSIYMITDKNIDTLYNSITSKKSNIVIDIPGNYKFIKSYSNAYIIKNELKENYKYEIKNSVFINGFGTIKKIDECSETDNFVTYLDSSEIKLPIYVRNRVAGDKMVIKNMDVAKKIKNIFIDCKLPIDKRDNYPIVVDASGEIIWLPGLKKSKFDRKNSGKYDIILKYE